MNINTHTMFYVYQYLQENGTPYYIGKGSGNRAWKKWSKKDVKPPKDASCIVIVEDNLSEDDAFRLECELISKYGRKDLGTGILHNKTNGGDGSSGHKIGGWKWSEESKAKRRGEGNPAFGKTTSQTQKLKASLTHKGQTRPNEWVKNMSESLIGREITWGDKISAALKGRKQDPEIVKKRAESCRRAWAAKNNK